MLPAAINIVVMIVISLPTGYIYSLVAYLALFIPQQLLAGECHAKIHFICVCLNGFLYGFLFFVFIYRCIGSLKYYLCASFCTQNLLHYDFVPSRTYCRT